jgi:hypothetical protein
MASKPASKTTEISFNIPSREEYLKRFKGTNIEVATTSENSKIENSSVKPVEITVTSETAVKAMVEKPDLYFDIPTKEEYSKRFESSKTEGSSGISPEEKSQVKSCDNPCDKPCIKIEETSKEKKCIKDASYPFPICYSGVVPTGPVNIGVLVETVGAIWPVEPCVDLEKEPSVKPSVFESKFLYRMEISTLPENIKVVVLNTFEKLATKVNQQSINERNRFHNGILLTKLSKIEDYYKNEKNNVLVRKTKNIKEFTLGFKYSFTTLINNLEIETCPEQPIKKVIIEELINFAKDNNYIVKSDIFDEPTYNEESSIDWIERQTTRRITFVNTNVELEIEEAAEEEVKPEARRRPSRQVCSE